MLRYKSRLFIEGREARSTIRGEVGEKKTWGKKEEQRSVPTLEKQINEFLANTRIVPGSLKMELSSIFAGSKIITQIIAYWQEEAEK
jgi:hypothetical protein